MIFTEIVLWISIFSIVYSWVIFPVVLFLMQEFIGSSNANLKTYEERDFPFLSIIIAAYNEEKDITARIENLLEQDYPKDKYEIIIASDGSKDKTVEIAKSYEKKNYLIKVLDFKKNRGKASVHNDSVSQAKGEIILFTDAGTIFEKNFLKEGVKWFANDKYGCGSGDYTFGYQGGIGQTENIYWRMEKQLRHWEFKLNLLPFASGGCFFLLKKLFKPIPAYSDIDNLLTLFTIKEGYLLFYAKDAKAYDYTIEGTKSHFKKRMRTTLRSMGDMLSYLPELIAANKWKTFWVLLSHRLIRWCTGYFMIITLITNIILVFIDKDFFYKMLLVLQFFYYVFVLLGKIAEAKNFRKNFIFKIMIMCYSFFLANLASTFAIAKIMKGEKIKVWTNV